MKAIKVTTDNVISMIDVLENGEPLYQIVKNTIGGYMENVYPQGLPENYVMIVDEEGVLKGKDINQIARLSGWKPNVMCVGFIEGAFCLCNTKGEYMADIHYMHPESSCDSEIIGNIHDNADLLEG